MVLMNPKTMNLINMYAYFQRLISTSGAVTWGGQIITAYCITKANVANGTNW